MASYWQLLSLIIPVFLLIGIGVVARRAQWIQGEAESSLVKLVVNLCYPCLVFESVVSNAALREPANLLLPPLLGFGLTALGIGASLYAGKWFGLTAGTGLRTFALTAGICNYSYLPLPITAAIWGSETQGVLMVHNVGVEAAMWTMGVLVLSGLPLREGWKKLINPVVLTLIGAVVINLSGLSRFIPSIVLTTVHALGVCAIPIGLVVIGVSLANYLGDVHALIRPNVMVGSSLLRLGILPLVILCAAKWVPGSVELKRVLVMQAAMPSAVFTIVLARHYGGQPMTAVQIVMGTTALGLVTIPLWLKFGLAWVGVH